ncbi:helix-hairpin-helix domain-containing protein [Natronobacterium gregoryi]|uniref:Excinuclease ABC subunit C n=2 Tax=Natronobacterium gregoryi TaxID=44930 RepID=L9YG93_NATGS|nr:helix-hairpin-helix domain-containing protein [Natronobacterium gregoryi]ELY72552.1 excinuclease ABC subunit C [Natronobacterium gregoryi SP2]PLK19814.1 hypothetical protein CYV19_12970 [Natronobacterium gregoryi SP2]SFJ30864.1 Helix-hairpin-helix motif-containing protein [Natronobacterium gregoryi]
MELNLEGVHIQTDGMDEFREISNSHDELVEEDIPGVDETDAARLLQEYRSLDAVATSSVEELARVDGISEDQAKAVHKHFRN